MELLRAGGKEWEREEWACAAKKEGRSGPVASRRGEGGSWAGGEGREVGRERERELGLRAKTEGKGISLFIFFYFKAILKSI